jgi:hypothetical protein
VKEPQAKLGVHVTLEGGAAIPGHGLGGVRRHALPALVHESHEELRGGVSGVGEGPPLAVGARVVGAAVGAPAVVEPGVDGRDRQDRERGEREGRPPAAYFQRTCTLTFGYSGSRPAASTMRSPPSLLSSRRSTRLTDRSASTRILLGAGGRR